MKSSDASKSHHKDKVSASGQFRVVRLPNGDTISLPKMLPKPNLGQPIRKGL